MSAPRAEDGSSRGMFRSLRVRNYRLFASANLVSLIGTWMQRIGQDWLVLQLSGDSGVALGLVTRTPHPTDGRQVVIDLTPAAAELLTEEGRAREAWLSGQLQDLSAEERAVLREAAVIIDKLASG